MIIFILLSLIQTTLQSVCIPDSYDISLKDFETKKNVIIYKTKGNPYPNIKGIDIRIKYLYDLFDLNNDGLLSFNEGRLYHELTTGSTEVMTFDIFKHLCKIIGCNPINGLNIKDFQNTYFSHKKILKTDLNHDYNKIKNIENLIILNFKGGYKDLSM